jgi:hypothetical protein
MGSGHFGATGFQNTNRETAFLYAFFLTVLGMGGAELAPAAVAPAAKKSLSAVAAPGRETMAGSALRAQATRRSSLLAPQPRDLV